MKIELSFIGETLASINCIFMDDYEIKKFDQHFPFGSEREKFAVNNETRASFVLPDEHTNVILAKAEKYRRIQFEDIYNVLKSNQVKSISEYLLQGGYIESTQKEQKVLSFIFDFIEAFEKQDQKLKATAGSIVTKNLEHFNIDTPRTRLNDTADLLSNLKEINTRLFALDVVFKNAVKDSVDEDNQQRVAMAISKYLDKLKGEYEKLFDRVTKLQTLIVNYNEENKAFLDADNKLNYLLNHLQPLQNKALLKQLILNENISTRKYILQTDDLRKVGQDKLKRVMLIRNAESAQDDVHDNAILEVTDEEANKHFFQIPNNMLSTTQLATLFLDHGAIVDFSNLNRGRSALGPQFFNNLACYTDDVQADYFYVHAQITQEVKNILPNIPTDECIEILLIGCGKGEEAEEIIQLLEREKRHYKIYAFDYSDENIAAAKQQPFVQNKPVYFMQGDANQFEEIIHDFRQQHNQGARASRSITIASGFLTRLVNQGSDEAFAIFKKIARHFDTIIIAGRTANLIKREDAKAAGFAIHHRTFRSSTGQLKTLDRYEALPIEQQVRNFLAKKSNDAPLNLTLKDHPNPMSIIHYLMRNVNVNMKDATFDLRDAYIDELDEQDSLHLKALESLLRDQGCNFVVTGHEGWVAALVNANPDNKKHLTIKENSPVVVADPNDAFLVTNERHKVSDKLRGRAEAALFKTAVDSTTDKDTAVKIKNKVKYFL